PGERPRRRPRQPDGHAGDQRPGRAQLRRPADRPATRGRLGARRAPARRGRGARASERPALGRRPPAARRDRGRGPRRALSQAIGVEGLERAFEEVRAVCGVDLTVDEGEIYAFLGPNGAGKTTTVRMLTTLLLPTGGRATVAGHDVVAEAREVRS